MGGGTTESFPNGIEDESEDDEGVDGILPLFGEPHELRSGKRVG